MKIELVITRHPGLVEYLLEIGLADAETVVLAHATPETVRGKHVCGVLPHSLSCLCASFTEVPLNVPQEMRGIELNLEQVKQYAGVPVTYRVTAPATFSTEVVEIVKAVSTNGYWGMSLVGPKGLHLNVPQEGHLETLGEIELDTFRFTPIPGCGEWWVLDGEVEAVTGCRVAFHGSLQSGNYWSLVVGGQFFAIRSYGYKRRSSEITCYKNGQVIKASAAVLAAMGIIPATITAVEPEIPALETAMAAALKKAGL